MSDAIRLNKIVERLQPWRGGGQVVEDGPQPQLEALSREALDQPQQPVAIFLSRFEIWGMARICTPATTYKGYVRGP